MKKSVIVVFPCEMKVLDGNILRTVDLGRVSQEDEVAALEILYGYTETARWESVQYGTAVRMERTEDEERA